MTTLTKVFQSGNSQAVRLPKEFQFHVDEVEICKRGNGVYLKLPASKNISLAQALAILTEVTEDVAKSITEARENDLPQERKGLFE